jgi:hypothetical protein
MKSLIIKVLKSVVVLCELMKEDIKDDNARKIRGLWILDVFVLLFAIRL